MAHGYGKSALAPGHSILATHKLYPIDHWRLLERCRRVNGADGRCSFIRVRPTSRTDRRKYWRVYRCHQSKRVETNPFRQSGPFVRQSRNSHCSQFSLRSFVASKYVEQGAPSSFEHLFMRQCRNDSCGNKWHSYEIETRDAPGSWRGTSFYSVRSQAVPYGTRFLHRRLRQPIH